jgi:hypothetical protein
MLIGQRPKGVIREGGRRRRRRRRRETNYMLNTEYELFPLVPRTSKKKQHYLTLMQFPNIASSVQTKLYW